MEWQAHIVSDPKVLLGKPSIKGTRLSVEFILERLADGWTEQEVLENYPRLTRKDALETKGAVPCSAGFSPPYSLQIHEFTLIY